MCPKHGGGLPRVRAKANQRIRDLLADAIDPNRVLREAGRLAYSNLQDLYDESGKLLPIKQWPEDAAHAVASIETLRGNVDKGDGKLDEVLRIRLHPKGGHIQDLMKHHGQLDEILTVRADKDQLAILLEGRARVAKGKA